MRAAEMFELMHGGPDAQGVVAHDFSTNGNACGPCPAALEALQAADASRYPDPHYLDLRERLAGLHGVEAHRIVIAASASEFIGRVTAAVSQGGGGRVRLPPHGYGDYARAAKAWHFQPATADCAADLVWCCDPGSPLGLPQEDLALRVDRLGPHATLVLDLAYEPLRLEGALALDATQRDRVWQLWTPNKALGLTGVRAAYAIAPVAAQDLGARLARLAPSWPLGAHGVALLEAWTGVAARQWLADSLATLRAWKAAQRSVCESLGWRCLPGDANFFCAEPDVALTPARSAALRQAGVKLRDTASFGLPGLVRLGVLPPASQQALRQAWGAARR
jgi:histidinol-phosphate aminotransferase